MGLPSLSSILANIIMDDFETHCLNALDFNVPVFYRYVDDIFAIVPRTEVNTILEVFNSYHPRLNFTHEVESNSSNFLNTTFIRKHNNLITNCYQKLVQADISIIFPTTLINTRLILSLV